MGERRIPVIKCECDSSPVGSEINDFALRERNWVIIQREVSYGYITSTIEPKASTQRIAEHEGRAIALYRDVLNFGKPRVCTLIAVRDFPQWIELIRSWVNL
jgi:hypothetical protein